MIISHQHRYVFVELPHTGTTAIASELETHYDGQRILAKHTPYFRFLEQATAAEKSYFAFSGIRNPLDVAVTKYFKYLDNHRGNYTDPLKTMRNAGVGNRLDRRVFHYVQREDIDFSRFFMKYYRLPYNSWACLDHHDLDFIIRFEHLQDDFAKALSLIGVRQVRPLPRVNPSARKSGSFDEHYSTLATRRRACRVFGHYMAEWGYDFPEDWEPWAVSPVNRAAYRLTTALMKVYWRRLKPVLFQKKNITTVPASTHL